MKVSEYPALRESRRFFHRALARTDLAVRLVQKKITGSRKVLEPDFRVWSWILANHILQSWHATTGLDIRPFSIGGMYGYGSAVGWFSGARHQKSHELSWIANGSVRVDPQQGDLPLRPDRGDQGGNEPLSCRSGGRGKGNPGTGPPQAGGLQSTWKSSGRNLPHSLPNTHVAPGWRMGSGGNSRRVCGLQRIWRFQ